MNRGQGCFPRNAHWRTPPSPQGRGLLDVCLLGCGDGYGQIVARSYDGTILGNEKKLLKSTAWINLKNIMLSMKSQTPKNTYM